MWVKLYGWVSKREVERKRDIPYIEKMYGIKCEDIAWCTFNTFLILSAHNHPDPGTGPNTQNKINGSLSFSSLLCSF